MKRSKSSQRWLAEHFKDNYVKQAQQQGYRARSAYKLLEIHQKDRLFKQGQTIIDLGAAPGGWSQVATQLVGKQGKVIAVDILPMAPLARVDFIQGDFRQPDIFSQLMKKVANRAFAVNLVMSDMAPNITGLSAVDLPKVFILAELALELALQVLEKGGDFLVKVFQGIGYESYILCLRQYFQQVIVRKPDASRARSRELYLLARGFRGKIIDIKV